VLKVGDSIDYLKNFIFGKYQGEGLCNFGGRQVFFGPFFPQDMNKQEPEGIISHLDTSWLMIAIGKHGLEVGPEFFNA
jgi:hypothetical protein